ncbi:AI-2E family transporter [Limisalsivibrio acetivorans]|uniref:AI-2E family transporter n=1 Tax=Limisalsivibrio acetivorans TaxID=1304888 RepID=UPI0003B4CC24|nr:AI-2E family transporter [Limisalsivibrio acetivorans]
MDIAKFDITLKNLLIVAAVAVVMILLYRLQSLVTTFAISFFLSYLFDPVVDWFEERKINRGLTIIFLYVIAAFILILFMSYLLPLLYNEAVFFMRDFPGYLRKLFDLSEGLAEKMNYEISMDGIRDFVVPKLGGISQGALKTFNSVIASMNSLVGLVLNLALIPILTFYFLKDFDIIRDKMFDSFTKHGWRDFPDYFMKFNSLLSRYFRGQVIVAAILGVLYTITLVAAGVKPALLLGIISGVLSIVPYLGFIIGFGAALILSVAQYGDLLHPAIVIIGFTIAQSLEGNIITPKIVGGTLNLHPTAVIFALMAGGSLMGIGGMIIALPIAAFLKILVSEYLNKKSEIIEQE